MTIEPQKTALLIAGPTASGKSALARRLARERGGIIINADAMQVYRDLRILTARPAPAEEAETPHRLYGHVSGADAYSTGRWLEEARRAMADCWAQGQVPIMCGGTGLYFKALLGGLAQVPPIPDDIRQHWRRFDGDLHAALAARDAESAARLHPSDRQRILRALEVLDATGQSLAAWQRSAQTDAPLQGASVEKLFLNLPRNQLYARAETRFDAMLAEGALAEVENLPDLAATQPVMKAIGVPELRAYVRGDIAYETAIRDAKTATRNYIKRQLTWWRGQMRDWTEIEA